MVEEISSQSAIDRESKTVICDFTATWCGPCKAIAPTFESLSKEYTSLKFYKVDVDKSPEIAQKYGVTAMPTFKVIKNGTEIEELRGASASALRNLCEKHKGSSSFTGKGRRLNESAPAGIKRGTDIQPPKALKTVFAFGFPFLIYLAINFLMGLFNKR